MDHSGLEELFDRFRRDGDLDALAEVFDRTGEKLLKVARHLSHDEAQAEDVVQATFLSAIESRDAFDASRELVPWLTGILTHKAKVARALSRRVPDPERLQEPASHDPAVDAELRDLRSTLESALDRVPPAYRDVLRLHLSDGKATEEIARELNRSAGTVRVQLHRGLKHLRRLLPVGFAFAGGITAGSARGIQAIRKTILDRAASIASAQTAAVSSTTSGWLSAPKIVATAIALLIAGWTSFVLRKQNAWDSRSIHGAPTVSRVSPELQLDLDAVPTSTE